MTAVEVEGEPAHVMTDDLDALVATRPTTAVRLAPRLRPVRAGSRHKDGHVVPPARRSAVSRQSGWISPVVVAGGRVSGTWALDGAEVQVARFRERPVGPLERALESEVASSTVLDRDLRAGVAVA